MNLVKFLEKRFDLTGCVVIHHSHIFGNRKVIIAHYFDGTIKKEEVLKKDIPFLFILAVKLVNFGTPVVVHGLITQEEIQLTHESFESSWESSGG